VLRLSLDTSDPLQRRRLEGVFAAAFSLRRALQRDVRSRLDAYASARRERAHGESEVRLRLGLTREALERAAYRHLDRAPHLRFHATKALAMHVADSVWTAAERHLFPDVRGHRSGKPRVGRWYRFTRIPGRARSHTRPAKWETFRLHGTLAGHRRAYTGADGRFYEPRSMRPVEAPDGSWWNHQGPLVVVMSGLGKGDLVLPVRLPASPCNQAILDHFLAEQVRWHSGPRALPRPAAGLALRSPSHGADEPVRLAQDHRKTSFRCQPHRRAEGRDRRERLERHRRLP